MVDNFSWVIQNKLAGSALPEEVYGGRRTGPGAPMASDLNDLHARGIRLLVSLTERAGNLGPYCREAGLDWLYYPIPDFGIPENQDSFDDLVSTIIASMDRARPVCVHCFAGVGRTGLVLCSVLGRYLKLPASRAVAAVRTLRSALETPEQESFVQRYIEQYSER